MLRHLIGRNKPWKGFQDVLVTRSPERQRMRSEEDPI